MKQEVLIGQTDYSVLVLIRDDAGAPATGLTEASIDIAYARVETDNDVTTTDVTPAALAALTTAHTDWGFEEVSATDHPGLYRLDIADAVFASGAWSAVVSVVGTGLDPCQVEFVLVAHSPWQAIADILTDTGTTLDGRIPAALVSGRMDASVGAMAANTLTATAINADAFTAAKFAADVTTELQSGLATAAALSTLDGKVDAVDNFIDTEIADIRRAIGPATTTIATLASQTSFTLTAGSADDGAYNGWGCYVIDASTATQVCLGVIEDYTGASKTVTLREDPGIFTMATTDLVVLLPGKLTDGVNVTQIEGVDATDQLDAHAAAGLDAAGVRAAIGLASANLDTQLSTIDTVVDAILVDTGTTLDGRIPAALVSGRMDASVGAMAANVMTAAAAAADLTTELQSGLATAAALATVDGIVDDILLDTAEIGAAGAGLTALATQTSVNTIDDLLDTEVAAIKTVVDAVKVQTDKLTFTVANVLDANVQRINDVTITGDGAPGTEFGV
jgi:hypothetical protein